MVNYRILYTGASKLIRRIVEKLNETPLLGSRHEDAWYGDLGEQAWQHSQLTEGNPHQVTLEDLGLGLLPRQLDMILEAIGVSVCEWSDHDDISFADYDGAVYIFESADNLLGWH